MKTSLFGEKDCTQAVLATLHWLDELTDHSLNISHKKISSCQVPQAIGSSMGKIPLIKQITGSTEELSQVSGEDTNQKVTSLQVTLTLLSANLF